MSDHTETDYESASALSHILTGAGVAVAGLVMWFATAGLPVMIPGTAIGPALLPRICASGFVLLGLALSLQGWGRRHTGGIRLAAGGEVSLSRRLRDPALLVPLALVAVWLLGPVIGLLSMSAAVGCLLMRARGGSWLGSLLCSVALSVVVHILFTVVMRIQMPQGILL